MTKNEALNASVAPKLPGILTDDPELKAMVKIAKLLNTLEPAARQRVLCWVCEKYAEKEETHGPE